MGNTNGGGSGGWRGENIVSASYHTRPLGSSSTIIGPIAHHGVVVHTDKGNDYLIHHPKNGVTTVTPASNMSNKW